MKPRTGAEKYFDQRMKDPSYAEEYAEAKARIDEIDAILGFIDETRSEQGISKAELARRAGLPEEAVRRLFTAEHRNPTLTTVLALGRALGVELFRVPERQTSKASSSGEHAPKTKKPAHA